MSDFNVIYNIIARDKFSGVGKKIGRSVHRLKARFRLARRELKKFGAQLKNFKSAAIAGAAILAFKKLTDVGGRFQDSLADLSAITGAVGKDLSFMREEAFKLGKEAAKSGDEVLTAFKLVASAKPELLENTKALAQVTKQVLLLANASGIELASAANITAQGLNIFGEGADQAARFVNVLAAGAKFGASEIAETGEAMLIAGPAARAAGLSFEQLNAAIQVTALGGIKASRAGTALNAILGRMRRAGIDFKKVGLQGAFELVKNALDKIKDPTKRAIAESKIFGEEHSKVGLAILNNAKMLDRFKRKLTGTNTAQEQANIRLSTFNSNWKKFATIIEEKVVGAFLLIEPLLSLLLKGAGAAISAIGTVLDVVLIRPLKIVGTLIGKIIGFFATGFDVSGFEGTLNELKNIAVPIEVSSELKTAAASGATSKEVNGATIPAGGASSQATVDVNLNAPEGIVKSVKSRSNGNTMLNVGTNMMAEGA